MGKTLALHLKQTYFIPEPKRESWKISSKYINYKNKFKLHSLIILLLVDIGAYITRRKEITKQELENKVP